MKIHNPTDLDFDPQTLRALARGDLDPVRLAVENHQKQAGRSLSREESGQPSRSAHARLPAGPPASPASLTVASPVQQAKSHETSGKESAKQPSATAEKSYEERKNEYQALYTTIKQLTKIIRECEALEVVNFELLALKHYPGSEAIAAAKRRRDLWLMCCLLCGGLVVVGWLGFLGAWLTGSLFGVLVLLLALTLTPFRKLIYQLPTLAVLKTMRKAMEFQALNHIKMLEGEHGLAYQCQRMQAYRPTLGDRRFQRLVLLSKQRHLIKAMRTVAGIRLYLSYLLEAQQAFSVVKQEYMKTSTLLKRDYAEFTLENAH